LNWLAAVFVFFPRLNLINSLAQPINDLSLQLHAAHSDYLVERVGMSSE
jgi:hypothetical protein